MDKNAIKKYAVWARRELIERVSQRAMIYGITAKDAGDPNAESVNGHLLSQAEKRQRRDLIRNIQTKGYEQVMEEVAYTWFNRFAALRFMEVNGYLPSHIRVFTNDAGEFKPQILAEAIHLELDGLDMNKVYELESANKSEELFKYLLIVQCNALSSILPGMFQRIEDYTELLLPDYLLREGSVIEQMVTTIPEKDWTDQVQIIGWLYQYYNTEPKDKVFADLKKNIKITKENIPAATQLFTPDWIVHYMVENSLGRLWLEGHPNDALKSEWKYYLDEADQESDVEAQLAAIRKEYTVLTPEEIRVIDPCMGSGHILCVLFDVLVRIYEDYGYTAREAAVKIVENNLWGLDIDERAAQLSCFAVMMKARQYDRRFFTRKVQPHVYAIEESNGITSASMHYMGMNLSQEEYGIATKQAMRLVKEMHDAKEYGSIIHVTPCDWDLVRRFAVPREEKGQMHLDILGVIEDSARLQVLINIGETLSRKYHVVVTNPPYMGNNNMDSKLTLFAKDNYPNSKLDLFAMMIERSHFFTKKSGFFSLITMHSWMFLSSFEKMRSELLDLELINCLHLGSHSFNNDVGTIVQNTAFIYRNNRFNKSKALFIRLVDFTSSEQKENNLRNNQLRFGKVPAIFKDIPGMPMAYWVSNRVLDTFEKSKPLSYYGDSRSGLQTSDNNRFLRLWFEVEGGKIGLGCSDANKAYASNKKWFPHTKGGTYRKWYGNIVFLVNWYHDGEEIKAFATDLYKSYSRIVKNTDYYFEKGITWSHTATKNHFGVRYVPEGVIFNVEAPTFFRCNIWEYMLALLNSNVASTILPIMNQTMHFLAGDTAKFPVIYDDQYLDEINLLVTENIALSKIDWDSQESSWEFEKHCLVGRNVKLISEAVEASISERAHIKKTIFNNEERLDYIFDKIYGFETDDVEKKTIDDVTVCENTEEYLVKSFISYAVGCMFGRYSLDVTGLVYTGGEWDNSKYINFSVAKDGIIPICDDEYFDDDIVWRFIKFVETVFGSESLEQNLKYIATILGGKGTPRDSIRNYFINDFYADHCSMYSFASSGKRPIYWLFDSGKKNGFKCLIYMHRYQPDTIARIRTDYVHEQQSRYRTAIADLEQRINGASASERVKLSKQLAKLQAQAEEIRVYEEKIHHLADQMIEIDLDDGVKANYAKFKDVLAKIK